MIYLIFFYLGMASANNAPPNSSIIPMGNMTACQNAGSNIKSDAKLNVTEVYCLDSGTGQWYPQ